MEDRLTKQVSVFLENKSGRLAEVCQTLGDNGVNIRALCIADTSDFGILRIGPHRAICHDTLITRDRHTDARLESYAHDMSLAFAPVESAVHQATTQHGADRFDEQILSLAVNVRLGA